MTGGKVKVDIPFSLAERLAVEAEKEGFENLSLYVVHLLRRSVDGHGTVPELSPEDEVKVKNRLRSLGYID